MFDRVSGVLETPVSEGTHFRVPYLQTPNVMDIRTRPRSISSVTGTKGEEFCRRLPRGAFAEPIHSGACADSRQSVSLRTRILTSPAMRPIRDRTQISRWSTSPYVCFPSRMSRDWHSRSGWARHALVWG